MSLKCPRAAAAVLAVATLLLAVSVPLRADDDSTKTPIKHVVVIFQENISFDHYFGTYPHAEPNADHSVYFKAAADTPRVNGLESSGLLTNNPNANNSANGANAINPFRLDRSQASTCDQNHNYGPEQQAFDQGLMDLFPATVGVGESAFCNVAFSYGKNKGLVMGYFDGNTVTALWNYAQHFAMSDNSYNTTFGPSTPGLLNLVSGNTYLATVTGSSPKVVPSSPGTIVGDLDPTGDACSAGATVQLSGPSVGDLLTSKGITWGSFMGGFNLGAVNANGTTGCKRSSPATPANGGPTADYIAHHAFFQYFASTANPTHVRPQSVSEIGNDGPANHEYDINDFFAALTARNLPAVSFLKAIAAQDGHAGYSDPLLEQTFLANTVNTIMESPYWKNTAIIILYDDSDGWYDHQMPPIVNPSAANTASAVNDSDELNGPGLCGHGTPLAGIQGRCGYGPRLPLLVISPWAKQNYVDHEVTDQSSVLRFIEDNWELGRIGGGSFDAIAGTLDGMFDFNEDGNRAPTLVLNPQTGASASDE
jgi:phospholipase C